jgi:uncharacterized protein (TIGR00725 family)
MPQKNVITVFGSSRPRPGDAEYDIALSLGAALAHAGFAVCNGGYGGIMEASARGAKESGGETVGVICSAFAGKHANPWIDTVIREESLMTRLMKLVEIAHGYVILKGGTGTLLELATIWELMNKGIMAEKPIVVLKEELAWEGAEDCTKFVVVVQSAEECIQVLCSTLRGV